MKKFFLSCAVALMATSLFAEEFNIYASGLQAGEVADGKVEISYLLNAPATALEFQVLNAEGAVVKAIAIEDAAALAKGAHEGIAIDLAGIAAGTYNWALKASAEARAEISAELLGMANATYWQPRDMAYNKNPESEFFGQLYVSNSANGGGDAYVGNSTAIYVFNPLIELQGSYDGGVAWSTNNGPHRLYIDEAGLVYASNRSDAAGGIFIMDPANPEAEFKSFFDPAKRGETYTKITGFDFAGEGAGRVLVTADAVSYDGTLVLKVLFNV